MRTASAWDKLSMSPLNESAFSFTFCTEISQRDDNLSAKDAIAGLNFAAKSSQFFILLSELVTAMSKEYCSLLALSKAVSIRGFHAFFVSKMG